MYHPIRRGLKSLARRTLDYSLLRRHGLYCAVVLLVILVWTVATSFLKFQYLRIPKHVQDDLEKHRTTFFFPSDSHTRTYTSVGNDDFYIFSVVANEFWGEVMINGWEKPFDIENMNKTYTCCFYYETGMLATRKTYERHTFYVESNILEARQITCNLPVYELILYKVYPIAFALKSSKEECYRVDKVDKIVYPPKQPRLTFAVCGGIVYGQQNPVYLIEWIEYQLFYKADAILIYAYAELNQQAQKVLNYYQETGKVEVVAVSYVPELDKWPRHFSRQGRLQDNDLQVLLLDAHSRLIRHKYMTVIQTDEFLVPSRHVAQSFLGLMLYLNTTYPRDIASYLLFIHLFPLHLNESAQSSPLVTEQFKIRTPELLESPRQLHITRRLKPGSMTYDDAKQKYYYNGVTTSPSEVVIKRYRHCRKDRNTPSIEKNNTAHCFTSNVLYDDDMSCLMKYVKWNITNTVEELGL